MNKTVAGVILAGGRSTRMGAEKALIDLAGEPVIARVIARLRPQVGRIVISANGDARRFEPFALPVIADTMPRPGDEGPLAGVIAGLEWAEAEEISHVVFVPGDAPFLPEDLVSRLGTHEDTIAVAESETGIEPLFSLWPTSTLENLKLLYAEGERAPRRAIGAMTHKIVPFEGDAISADPFFNLNRPDDVAAAEFWIKGW